MPQSPAVVAGMLVLLLLPAAGQTTPAETKPAETNPAETKPAQAAPPTPRAALARVEEVGQRLHALADAHPEAARLEQVGRSLSGREILALRIGPTEGDPPGLLVVAGLDGRRVADTDAALQLAERLLSGAEPDAAGRLAEACIVILPLVNPDGAATLLGEDGPVRERAGNGRPDDADRDGRADEDGPADLDGDGVIAWMRVPDAKGEWVQDDKDPRAMRKARRDRGERGAFRLIREGLDHDGDGEYGEDGTDGVEPDRNFMHGWKPDAAAGEIPLSEPESRALCEFVQARPRLFAVLVLGGQDTLAELPRGDAKAPNRWEGPLNSLIDDDLGSLKELQRRLRALPGGADHKVKGAGLSDGSFLAWSYHQAGRLPLALRLWEPPTEMPKSKEDKAKDDKAKEEKADKDKAEKEKPEKEGEARDESKPKDAESKSDAKGEGDAKGKRGKKDDDAPGSDSSSPAPAAVLAWLDAERGGEGVIAWKPFHHPQLGDVEIGGLRPGVLLNAPPQVVADKLPLLAGFALSVLDARAKLRFEDAKAERGADGVYTLSIALVNDGALPALSALERSADIVRPLNLHLVLPSDAQRIAGPVAARAEKLDGGGGRQEFRWVLAASAGEVVKLSADSDALPGAATEVTLP
jgi:hypothetical protein